MRKQVCRVVSQDIDGNEDGHHWRIQYAVYELDRDEQEESYNHWWAFPIAELCQEDDLGNGEPIAIFVNGASCIRTAIHHCLQLGRQTEWEAGRLL